MKKPGKLRLDVLMVERGLVQSRERARSLLLAGQVRVEGQKNHKPGSQIATDAHIELIGPPLRYASRGGLKLEGALQDFSISPANRVCLDAGSSTGGFTDCLLQHGARQVYAVDVTISQLDWRLSRDVRVIRIERNARYLSPADIAQSPDFITLDVSFISVTKVLPAVMTVSAPEADFLILIKPQFELGKSEISRGGIVHGEELHRKAIDRVTQATAALGLEITGVRLSRLVGAAGNQEFFLHARRHK